MIAACTPENLGAPEIVATDEWFERVLPLDARDPRTAMIFRVTVDEVEYIYRRVEYNWARMEWRCRWVD